MNLVDRAFIKAYSKQNANAQSSDAAKVESAVAQELGVAVETRDAASAAEIHSGSKFLINQRAQRVPVPQSIFVSLSGQAAVENPHKLSLSGIAEHTAKIRIDAAHERAAATGSVHGDRTGDTVSSPHFLSADSTLLPANKVVLPPENAPQQPLANGTCFRATWEVDRFRWPQVCQQLLDAETDYFSSTVKLLAGIADGGDRSFAVLSPESGDGCTTVTLCLACQLAEANLSVALVDADAERPELARRLDVQVAVGWNDVNVGRTELTEVAITSLDDNVTLVPLRDAIPVEERSNLRPRAIQLMHELASHHDLVLVDAGRTSCDLLGLLTAEHIGGLHALFVKNLRPNPKSHGTSELERLRLSAIPIVGIAENFAA